MNPNKASGGFGLSIWNVNPDTWEHYFDTIVTAIIKKVSISKVNLWAGEEGVINISCLIIDENNGAIRYKVLVNEEEVIPLSQPYSTTAEIEIPIPKTVFTEEENLFTLVVVDERDKEVSFSYIITVEDRDTFTFKRVFDFKEDYITDENVEVIYGEGLTLKEIGWGEVNIEIPTEGKSKISNIVIEGGEDKEEELIIEREMTYLNDLGEGKVYEGRVLVEYNDILDIKIVGDLNG